MNDPEIFKFICERLQEAATAKGAGRVKVADETPILDGGLPIDSLDLAGIVVQLEQVTGRDPFQDGFINFRTVGELARLYSGKK
jgi:acyl carrier protein